MIKKDFIIFIGVVLAAIVAVLIINYFSNKDSVSDYNPLPLPSFNKKEEYNSKYLSLFDDLKNDFITLKKDFLEVNLEEMKMRFFKMGLPIKEVDILAKGDSMGWGGSAVGLYNVLRGYKLSFSNIEEVYMPYALHYYGKYYIHGEPYYSGGEKLISSVSGGCLRLKDKDAKAIFELSSLNLPILVIDKEKDNYKYEKKDTTEIPDISATSYLVADLDSGYVFAEKNSKDPLPIASLTKLMIAVTITENVSLKRSVLIKQKMLDSGYGVTEGLKPGNRFRLVELLYPLLIESSNDAAYALTYFLGKEKTVELMNEKAKSILMKNTRFIEPSGFDPGNISTSEDLFYLARYVRNNRFPLLEISKGNRVTSFGKVGFSIKEIWNKNIFINDPDFVGGKTGKENKERDIAIILLGSNNLKTDTQKLHLWLSNNYFN